MNRMEEFLTDYGSLHNNKFIDQANGLKDERKGKTENYGNLFETFTRYYRCC